MSTHSLPDTKFLQVARGRYKMGDEAEAKQRERENDDISFEDGNQWPSTILAARQAQNALQNMPAVPQRPSLVINKIREPIQNTLNQVRASDMGVEVIAANDFGDLSIIPDDTEVQLREGLIRRIQRESNARAARIWALKRALVAGRGYYLVMTRYLPGKTFDQEIFIDKIYHQEAVVGDPTRQLATGKDADWWFIGDWVPWDRFYPEYPEDVDGEKNPFADARADDFISQVERYPNWYSVAKDTQGNITRRNVRVVSYWWTERTTIKLALMPDGSIVEKKDVPKDAKPLQTRDYEQKQIMFARIAGGVMVVEKTEWAGPDMPVIQVTGDEILPYDDEKRYEGMVRQARGAQQGENYMISKFVETVGLTPISPLQVDPEAISGYEEWYNHASTRAWPYLPYRTYDDDGKQFEKPHRPAVDPNILPMAQGIALFDQFIRSTTHVPDSMLGDVDPALKSAKALQTVFASAQVTTSGYGDNFVDSVTYEGEVINNLLYPIYGQKPGRLLRIVTGDNKSGTMQIGGGDPQAQAREAAAAKVAKLTEDAHFSIIIRVIKNSESRRAQFVQMFGQILSANPQQMGVGGDLFYQNLDIPEARQLAKRQRAMLAPQVQQVIAAEEQGQNVDPIAQGKIVQLTEQLKHAEAAMMQEHQLAEGKLLQYRATVESERLKQDSENYRVRVRAIVDVHLQAMKNAGSERAAQIAAEAKLGIETASNDLQLESLDKKHEHEMAIAAIDAAVADAQRTHEAAQGAAAAGAAADSSEVAMRQQPPAQPAGAPSPEQPPAAADEP